MVTLHNTLVTLTNMFPQPHDTHTHTQTVIQASSKITCEFWSANTVCFCNNLGTFINGEETVLTLNM